MGREENKMNENFSTPIITSYNILTIHQAELVHRVASTVDDTCSGIFPTYRGTQSHRKSSPSIRPQLDDHRRESSHCFYSVRECRQSPQMVERACLDDAIDFVCRRVSMQPAAAVVVGVLYASDSADCDSTKLQREFLRNRSMLLPFH